VVLTPKELRPALGEALEDSWRPGRLTNSRGRWAGAAADGICRARQVSDPFRSVARFAHTYADLGCRSWRADHFWRGRGLRRQRQNTAASAAKTLVSVGFHACVKKGVGALEVRRRDSKHWRKLATALPMEASGQDPFSRLPVTALCGRTAVGREARRHDKAWIE